MRLESLKHWLASAFTFRFFVLKIWMAAEQMGVLSLKQGEGAPFDSSAAPQLPHHVQQDHSSFQGRPSSINSNSTPWSHCLQEGHHSANYAPLFEAIHKAIGSRHPIPMPKDFVLEQLLPPPRECRQQQQKPSQKRMLFVLARVIGQGHLSPTLIHLMEAARYPMGFFRRSTRNRGASSSGKAKLHSMRQFNGNRLTTT